MKVIAGSFSYGGKAGVGASVAYNKIANRTDSKVMSSTLTHDGTLTLSAVNDADIKSAAGSIGASKSNLGASGTVAINVIRNEVEASVRGSSNVESNVNGSINIKAEDASRIESLGGAVGAAKAVGFGGGLAYNLIDNQIEAFIDDSQIVTAGSLQILAVSTGRIRTIAAGGAGAKKLALAGGVALNSITTTIDAYVSNSQKIEATGSILVSATDSSSIGALAGGAAGAGKVAIGAAVSTNDISNTIEAYVKRSTVESTGSGFEVSATSTSKIDSLTVGGAGAGKFALGGSVSLNEINNTVDARISNDSTVTANGTVTVLDATNPAIVDGNENAIIFSEPHGLVDGQAVLYSRRRRNPHRWPC